MAAGNPFWITWTAWVNRVSSAYWQVSGHGYIDPYGSPRRKPEKKKKAYNFDAVEPYSTVLSFDDYEAYSDYQDVFPKIHRLILKDAANPYKLNMDPEILQRILELVPLIPSQGYYRDKFMKWLAAHEVDRDLGASITYGIPGTFEMVRALQPVYGFPKIYIIRAVFLEYDLPAGDNGIRTVDDGNYMYSREATPQDIEERLAVASTRIAEANRWLGWIFDKKTVHDLSKGVNSEAYVLLEDACMNVRSNSYCLNYVFHYFGNVGNSLFQALYQPLGDLPHQAALIAVHPLLRRQLAMPQLDTFYALKSAIRHIYANGGSKDDLVYLLSVQPLPASVTQMKSLENEANFDALYYGVALPFPNTMAEDMRRSDDQLEAYLGRARPDTWTALAHMYVANRQWKSPDAAERYVSKAISKATADIEERNTRSPRHV